MAGHRTSIQSFIRLIRSCVIGSEKQAAEEAKLKEQIEADAANEEQPTAESDGKFYAPVVIEEKTSVWKKRLDNFV
jgi:hypothetical protein